MKHRLERIERKDEIQRGTDRFPFNIPNVPRDLSLGVHCDTPVYE